MRSTDTNNWLFLGVIGALIGLLAWPFPSEAQTVSGQASAVRATMLGTTTSLADTGTLSSTSDPREAGQVTGSIPNLLAGETLSAATMGWPDQVASQASLTNLGLTVAGTSVTADLVMSRALAVLGGTNTGLTNIDGLLIGGASVIPTGAPNQNVSLGALSIILNEQIPSADGITVNAIHVKTLDGLTDVVIGSSMAAISSSGSTSGGSGTGILPALPLSGTTSLF